MTTFKSVVKELYQLHREISVDKRMVRSILLFNNMQQTNKMGFEAVVLM